MELAFEYDRRVMIEEYIPGREFTVGILDNLPLEAIEIKPKSRFFDYKAKYEDDKTEYIVPAKVPLKTMQALKSAALRAHNALGCFFFSRADIILSGDSRPFILEVNTIPGFTSTSLLPKAALCKGITFSELVLNITQSAWLTGAKNNKTLWQEKNRTDKFPLKALFVPAIILGLILTLAGFLRIFLYPLSVFWPEQG